MTKTASDYAYEAAASLVDVNETGYAAPLESFFAECQDDERKAIAAMAEAEAAIEDESAAKTHPALPIFKKEREYGAVVLRAFAAKIRARGGKGAG